MVLRAIVQLLLVAVFLLAGVAKLLDMRGSRDALGNFGVPKFLIPPFTWILPALEIFLASGLFWTALFRAAAIGLSCLSFLLLVAVIYQLAKGRKPDCHCFGQFHSKPLSGSTVVRNTLILAAALWLATLSPLPENAFSVLWTYLTALSATMVNLLVLTIVCTVSLVQTFFLFEVMKQNGRLMLKLESLADAPQPRATMASHSSNTMKSAPALSIGSPAPEFELSSIKDDKVSLSDLRGVGKSTLLVFSDPSCGPCKKFMPELASFQSVHQNLLTIAIVSRGSVEANLGEVEGLNYVLLQKDREVSEAYRCQGTPGAVLVGVDGNIASDLAHGSLQIGQLVKAFAGPKSNVQRA